MDEHLLKMLEGLQRFVFQKTRLGMHRVIEDEGGVAVVTFSPIDDRLELSGNRIVLMFGSGVSIIEVTGHRLERFRTQIEEWILTQIKSSSGEESCTQN